MTQTPPHRLPPHRRGLLLSGAAFLTAACTGQEVEAQTSGAEARYASSEFRRLNDAQWRERLPALSYRVLRHEATERAGTSPLDDEHRTGVFHCLGCDLPLFRSAWKFDSGTGWPSFFRVIEGAVGTRDDYAIGVRRTEYHCARCLGHHGHLFNDGPRPTGLRYCNNGAALRFRAA